MELIVACVCVCVCVCVCARAHALSHFCCVQLFVTPWTVACRAPLSMGILQARILAWVAISSSRGSSQARDQTLLHLLHRQVSCFSLAPPGKPKNGLLLLLSHFSRVRLCATPEMAAHQAPLSLGFSRQEHWSGLPFPSPVHESEK